MPILRLANQGQKAGMDAVAAQLNLGTIKFYSGSMPTNPDDALGAQVLLATMTFGNPAFGAADNDGIVTANTIASDLNAVGGANVAWARLARSDGTLIMDCDVGLTTGVPATEPTIIVDELLIQIGAKVKVNTFVLQLPQE